MWTIFDVYMFLSQRDVDERTVGTGRGVRWWLRKMMVGWKDFARATTFAVSTSGTYCVGVMDETMPVCVSYRKQSACQGDPLAFSTLGNVSAPCTITPFTRYWNCL